LKQAIKETKGKTSSRIKINMQKVIQLYTSLHDAIMK